MRLNCEDPQGVHVHSPDSWDAKGKEIQQVSGLPEQGRLLVNSVLSSCLEVEA